MSPPRERRQQKTEEKQNKHAINVDVETINESNVDAENAKVYFKEDIESIHEPNNETLVLSKLTIHGEETKYFYLYERRIENLAAIKIQTAFRGYLVCFFFHSQYELISAITRKFFFTNEFNFRQGKL